MRFRTLSWVARIFNVIKICFRVFSFVLILKNTEHDSGFRKYVEGSNPGCSLFLATFAPDKYATNLKKCFVCNPGSDQDYKFQICMGL